MSGAKPVINFHSCMDLMFIAAKQIFPKFSGIKTTNIYYCKDSADQELGSGCSWMVLVNIFYAGVLRMFTENVFISRFNWDRKICF